MQRVIGTASVTLHNRWLYLRSGIASVSTDTQYILKNECLSVQPGSNAQTQFPVTPFDGRMDVFAEKALSE